MNTKKKSFAEIKAEFKKIEDEKKNHTGNNDDYFKNSDIYPFWNIQNGEECIVRILPDANPDNPHPFPISREKLEHTISVSGKDIKIPSLEMWGERDPIAELAQKYYKAKDKENGKYYWRKKTNVLRAIIITDPLPESEKHESAEGKKKTLLFSFQLMQALNAAISQLDDEDEPWDLEKGYNFLIKKTAIPGGDNSTYAIGSGFVRKSTDVTKLVESLGGLDDLETFLPANPGIDKVERLLYAHLNGGDVEEEGDDDGDDGNGETNKNDKPATNDNKLDKSEKVARSAKVKEEIDKDENTDDDDTDDDDDELMRQIKERAKKRASQK